MGGAGGVEGLEAGLDDLVDGEGSGAEEGRGPGAAAEGVEEGRFDGAGQTAATRRPRERYSVQRASEKERT